MTCDDKFDNRPNFTSLDWEPSMVDIEPGDVLLTTLPRRRFLWFFKRAPKRVALVVKSSVTADPPSAGQTPAP